MKKINLLQRFVLIFLIIFPNTIYLMKAESNSKILPFFQLEDQFGQIVRSEDLIGENIILVGCNPEDETVCRKVARKIFWKLESHIMKDKVHIKRIGYLNLKDKPDAIINKWIRTVQKSGIEFIYLDKKGYLGDGIQNGKVWIRCYNQKGIMVHEDYVSSMDNKGVENIFNHFKNK